MCGVNREDIDQRHDTALRGYVDDEVRSFSVEYMTVCKQFIMVTNTRVGQLLNNQKVITSYFKQAHLSSNPPMSHYQLSGRFGGGWVL